MAHDDLANYRSSFCFSYSGCLKSRLSHRKSADKLQAGFRPAIMYHVCAKSMSSVPVWRRPCQYVGKSIAGSQSQLAIRSTGFGSGGATRVRTGLTKGPVIFRALPKGPAQGGNNTAKNVLVIYDFAKCRGGPGDPSAPEVFYEFKIRNESTVDVPFMLEIVLFSDLPINHG